MFSRFFIERPVLSNVIALVIMFLGVVALVVLPVSQFPQITPPTVVVTAYYPGASAQTVIDKVALPIELQVNGVAGMLYMQSSSTDNGNYTLTVSFKIGSGIFNHFEVSFNSASNFLECGIRTGPLRALSSVVYFSRASVRVLLQTTRTGVNRISVALPYW
jgi:hypothetical protein